MNQKRYILPLKPKKEKSDLEKAYDLALSMISEAMEEIRLRQQSHGRLSSEDHTTLQGYARVLAHLRKEDRENTKQLDLSGLDQAQLEKIAEDLGFVKPYIKDNDKKE